MGSYYRGGGFCLPHWQPGSNSSGGFFFSNVTKKIKGERNKRKDDGKVVNNDSVPLRNVCYGSDPTRLTHFNFLC